VESIPDPADHQQQTRIFADSSASPDRRRQHLGLLPRGGPRPPVAWHSSQRSGSVV